MVRELTSQEVILSCLDRIAEVEKTVTKLLELGRATAHARIYDLEVLKRTGREEHEHALALEERLDQVDARLRSTEFSVDKISALSAEVLTLKEQVVDLRPLLDSVRDLAAAGAKSADVHFLSLWDRFEFVRRELLFEMARGGTVVDPPLKPKTLSEAKVESARSSGLIKLNLGCGHIARADYINVDTRDLPGVDIVSDVGNLPFDAESVSEISSAHLLEHFTQEKLRRDLLPFWLRLLKAGGTFHAVTPDASAMLQSFGAGTYDFDDFREVVFGAQDYVGDFHFNLFTPSSLMALLKEAGFVQISVPVEGRRNGRCFEFEITAVSPQGHK